MIEVNQDRHPTRRTRKRESRENKKRTNRRRVDGCGSSTSTAARARFLVGVTLRSTCRSVSVAKMWDGYWSTLTTLAAPLTRCYSQLEATDWRGFYFCLSPTEHREEDGRSAFSRKSIDGTTWPDGQSSPARPSPFDSTYSPSISSVGSLFLVAQSVSQSVSEETRRVRYSERRLSRLDWIRVVRLWLHTRPSLPAASTCNKIRVQTSLDGSFNWPVTTRERQTSCLLTCQKEERTR